MGLTRREGDVEVARHLHNAGESLAAAVQAARAGAFQTVEQAAISFSCKRANDTIMKLIDQELGGDDFLALWPDEELPERFPPMERPSGPIKNRGDVMMALQDIDNALYRKPEPWPFKGLSNALRAIVARLEAEEEGKPVNWGDDPATVVQALKTALRERTPVAYFAYGAINHSGGFHSGEHRHGGRVGAPNRPGWFYFEAEHSQWAGPFPTERAAREACGDVGDGPDADMDALKAELRWLRGYYGEETGNEHGPMMQTEAREYLCHRLDKLLDIAGADAAPRLADILDQAERDPDSRVTYELEGDTDLNEREHRGEAIAEGKRTGRNVVAHVERTTSYLVYDRDQPDE